jgi:hypothetical protein
MHEHLGVHRRREDRALILELATQLGRVREVAVVGERDVAAAKPRQHRLGVFDGGGSRGAVARVADGERALEGGDGRAVEAIRDEPHLASRSRVAVVVDRHDARGLLTAMLQRVQSQMDHRGGLGSSADAEYPTHRLSCSLW